MATSSNAVHHWYIVVVNCKKTDPLPDAICSLATSTHHVYVCLGPGEFLVSSFGNDFLGNHYKPWQLMIQSSCPVFMLIVQIPPAARLPRIGVLARGAEATGVDWSDPCYLARAISRQAYDALMEHFESADWFQDTILSCCMRAHKNTELFIGPEFVILPLCRSDRPAYIIDPEDANTEAATGKTIEFLHMYPCMGLKHAHELQQVLLARCKTHVVAAAVVRVAILDLSTSEILCITTLMTLFRSNWRKAIWDQLMHKLCFQDQSKPIPTDSRGDLTAEYVCLLKECLEIAQKHRSDQAVPSTPQVSPACRGQDYVRWVHTTGLARVPATEILPRCYARTVDHVLSFEWLRRKRITHVLCLLGQHQLPLVQLSCYKNIFYLAWSINFPPHFKLIAEVFQSMRQILADSLLCLGI
jgi:hypothetical protein